MAQPRNLIFWGAGATAELGMRVTADQGKYVCELAGAKNPSKPLEERIADALGGNGTERWHSALHDLITILGDTSEAYRSIHLIDAEQMEALRRNWQAGADEDELKRRIIELRLTYDWPALKSVVRICPGSATDGFKINDLFNVLDMHIPLKFGFRAPADKEREWTSTRAGEQFFDARRLIGAKNALLLVLTSLFYIDYQSCIRTKRDVLEKYSDFAAQIANRMQGQGVELAGSGRRLDWPEFYHGDITFVSLNYDPIGLWIQFIAHRELNRSGAVPHIGSPAVPLHLYHDFGHLIPARRIGRGEASWPWYPLNVAAAQRLNEQEYPSGYRVRLTKFLFPHGCLCWRECPDCGKLSAYHGDQWDLFSNGLFPPPPLQAFDDRPCPDWIEDEERKERQKGIVDARACLHCGTLTYAHHTQAVMQSSFKSQPPSFIEEIQRELRATAMGADHVIFMGYSLPPDDVTYRAFFSARCQRERQQNQPVRCTIVDKYTSNPDWYGPGALKARDFLKRPVVVAAKDIFGEKNIRFFGGGVPNVFLDEGGRATTDKLEQLLNWSSSVTA